MATGDLYGVVMFHLNLCYSSIEVERRPEVVRCCYWPMLRLAEALPELNFAVEASGHTLELIREIDPSWERRLRELVEAGRVELVGCGDTQLIGPLVPAAVNRWNQRLGREIYEQSVGSAPRVALINEMAWSQGLIDHYLDAGYEAVMMEWNNPRLTHPEWDNELRYQVVRTPSPGGRAIDLLWVDTRAFQKFQRMVCEEIDAEEYRAWVRGQRGERPRVLFLYANDAEIFDFRPGRFETEPVASKSSEWKRIGEVLGQVYADGLEFLLPGQVLEQASLRPQGLEAPCVELTSAADPIPVKKQPKYNVTRWALSGRDDVGINAACFARAKHLEASGGGSEQWRQLCRLWSSDQRTHLTQKRWELLQQGLADTPRSTDSQRSSRKVLHEGACFERRGRRVLLRTASCELTLNCKRGLTIEAARFHDLHPSRPILGTLEHGFFDHIHWTADFYSGHTVAELPGQRRVADLQPVEPTLQREDGGLRVRATIPTPLGELGKELFLTDDELELSVDLRGVGERPLGSFRTHILTLHPDWVAEGLELECAHGGEPERFQVKPTCDHGRGLGPFISASAALAATQGRLVLRASGGELELSWDPTQCAALPLLTCVEVDGRWMTRLAFSLSEVDDTHRPGAQLPDRFTLTLTPRRPSTAA